MKNKIYYLARSYPPYQKGGGPLMRKGAIKYLKALGWDITVVMPNYNSMELVRVDEVIQIPFPYTYIQKLTSLLERIGIYEDYLDKWVEEAFAYLKDKVRKEDILFATSGGELGMIKLASLLKYEIGCKFVINFRDPLNYGYMNRLRRDKKFHIGREKAHEKYMLNADLILTSSQYYADILSQRFTALAFKIKNNYFGYIEPLKIDKFKEKKSSIIKIAYVGTMSKTQSPELLYNAWKRLKNSNIEIYFIGNTKGYKPLSNIHQEGVYFINFMPHEEFLTFMSEHIDVGFVSLSNDYFGVCVPSKIYEYINLGLPMIGALPNGDGKDIININGYGVACYYQDIECILQSLKKMGDRDYLNKIRKKILQEKEQWAMEYRIMEVDKLLKDLI